MAAVGIVGAMIVLGQAHHEAPAVATVTEGKVKGAPAAPVTVEEWGDFQ
jgi:hypothetical protein